MGKDKNSYTHRYIAQFLIEAATPLAIGSGENNIVTDSEVMKDMNGLPYIPGTSLAGVVRHAIGEEKAKSIFGHNEGKGEGSLIIFSSAYMVDENGKVIEGLLFNEKSEYLKFFDNLPVRQHVCITDKGVGKKGGKFDEEIVYKGTRFRFEIEMLAKNEMDKKDEFISIIEALKSSSFRIGSGTRNGFGEIKVLECNCRTYNLKESLKSYLEKKASLNDLITDDGSCQIDSDNNLCWIHYKLDITPDDFFLFASPYGDKEAKITPVSEFYFKWDNKDKKPVLKKDTILIPGSSIKGAISHRLAFHYNKLEKKFADQIELQDFNQYTEHNNKAVRILFGYTVPDSKKAERGNVIISDVIQKKETEQNKLLNHVAIDRFTGGTIDGALFSEKVIYGKEKEYTIDIKVLQTKFIGKDANIILAFENTLKDIASGILPLGGGINRGHGCFTGKITKDKETIYEY